MPSGPGDCDSTVRTSLIRGSMAASSPVLILPSVVQNRRNALWRILTPKLYRSATHRGNEFALRNYSARDGLARRRGNALLEVVFEIEDCFAIELGEVELTGIISVRELVSSVQTATGRSRSCS